MILFKPKLHKRFLTSILNGQMKMPHSLDNMTVTLSYFVISALDVLNVLDTITDEQKCSIIQWVYQLQNTREIDAGFQNGSVFNKVDKYRSGHIAATYSALNILLILGDDLKKINKKSIIKGLRNLQLSDGSFCATKDGSENDMRFVYCAASICYILDDWSGMDVELAVKFILNSISYDFGIAQGPYLESHGGSTYCGIATLVLTNQLHRLSSKQREGLKRWILRCQGSCGGFHGRPNKPEDTCYSFWLGATLKLIGGYDDISHEEHINFILSTQHQQIGGIAKCCNNSPDPLHTYLGLAGLSFTNLEGLNPVVPTLNITHRAYTHLQNLQSEWRGVSNKT